MIHYATERLIDSVWTMAYKKVNDSQVEIISFNRLNPIGYEQEKKLDRLAIEEDNNRTVKAIYVEPYEPFKSWASGRTKRLEVVNPKHIFSYENI